MHHITKYNNGKIDLVHQNLKVYSIFYTNHFTCRIKFFSHKSTPTISLNRFLFIYQIKSDEMPATWYFFHIGVAKSKYKLMQYHMHVSSANILHEYIVIINRFYTLDGQSYICDQAHWKLNILDCYDMAINQGDNWRGFFSTNNSWNHWPLGRRLTIENINSR